MQRPVIIGRVGRAYGVRGWLHIHSFTDPIENICQYPCWQLILGQQQKMYHVIDCKPHGNSLVAKLKNINDRDQASLLTNANIAVERDELPTLKDDEYYWTDLIGLEVITLEGTKLGTVAEIFATGSNDVFVVKGDKERLLPYIDEVIKSIDLKQNCITVCWNTDD
ncbi:MAG: ribosome maturation factor RimM [Gammaproteobacteria bacterium]|nr:ribosome maturation factor RimM [Gammaproteobacteria bacterium]